jgi:hypothetical protein
MCVAMNQMRVTCLKTTQQPKGSKEWVETPRLRCWERSSRTWLNTPGQCPR